MYIYLDKNTKYNIYSIAFIVSVCHITSLSLSLSLWGHLHSAYSSHANMQTRHKKTRHLFFLAFSPFPVFSALCVSKKVENAHAAFLLSLLLTMTNGQMLSRRLTSHTAVASLRRAMQNTKFLDMHIVQNTSVDSKTVGK